MGGEGRERPYLTSMGAAVPATFPQKRIVQAEGVHRREAGAL
jgi:hypothetical protein